MRCPIVTIVTLGFSGAKKCIVQLSQLSRLGAPSSGMKPRRYKEDDCGKDVERCGVSVDFCKTVCGLLRKKCGLLKKKCGVFIFCENFTQNCLALCR